MKTILPHRVRITSPRRPVKTNEDELIVWARRTAATPSPLVTDRERDLVADLLAQVEGGR